MNLFGVDVRALDVDAFLAAARHIFPLLALAWLVLVVRLRRPGMLLLGSPWRDAAIGAATLPGTSTRSATSWPCAIRARC